MSQATHKGPLGAPTAAAFSRPEAVPQKDQAQLQPVPAPQPAPESEVERLADEVPFSDQDPESNQETDEAPVSDEDADLDEDEESEESEDDEDDDLKSESLSEEPHTPSRVKLAPWVPQSAWKHLLYRFRLNLGYTFSDRIEYADALGDAMFELNDEVRAIRIMVTSASGGATKSTTLANLATVFGFWLNQQVVVIDNNPDFDPIDAFLGIDPKNTLSVREAAEVAPRLTSATDFKRLLAWTSYGVGLICSDSKDRAKDRDRTKDPYTHRMSSTVMDMAYKYVGHTFINTGTSVRNPVVMAGLGVADVVIVPALPSANKMRGAKDAAGKLAVKNTQTMRHAIFMMNAIESGHNTEEYRESLGLDDKQILLGSPYDERLKHDAIVDLTSTELLTIIAYLELGVTSLLTVRHRDASPTAPPLDIGPGRVLQQLNMGDSSVSLPWAPKKSH